MKPHCPAPSAVSKPRRPLRGAPAALLLALAAIATIACLPGRGLRADDRPQWGERFSRNMVSPETGLPVDFDPETGRNIRWSVSLGRANYSTPVISGGRVLVGADNSQPRDPRHQGDRGLLLCLEEATGKLLWQLVVPRTGGDIFLDWPNISMCSVPTIDGDRAYTLTNRFELVCLDMDGQADGNDGPYVDEGRHMAESGSPPLEVTPLDADIIWMLDMPKDVGMYPHDSAFTSILVRGPHLYLNSCNGVDNTHKKIRRPDAPSLIVVDKRTGALVARDDERIAPRIFHSTWSSPALGEVGGQPLVFFCGGDGVCYAFKPVDPEASTGPVRPLERIWRFDCDPKGPKEEVHRYNQNREESPSNVKSMPVFHDGRLYVTVGGDIWWGKEQAWLQCIDARGKGDITDGGLIWSYPLEPHCCSTPAIASGLVFVPDCSGKLHCVDAATGKGVWIHELRREIWGSALVADGKVYVASKGGDLAILAASREKTLLGTVKFDEAIDTTPVAANGVLYIATLKRLYAIQAPPAARP